MRMLKTVMHTHMPQVSEYQTRQRLAGCLHARDQAC